jgi:FkbM family methyltransferase
MTIVDLLRLLARRGAERRVPLRWLLHAPGRTTARFAATAHVQVVPESDGDDLMVKVNGEPYAWPKDTPLDDLLAVVSELALPDHPHQYLWGPTPLRRGDVVLDIGSCEGSFAALAAEKGAQVVAVEPSEKMRRVIRRLFELRGLPQPQIVDCALGASEGSATLLEAEEHPAYASLRDSTGEHPHMQHSTVRIMTLDQLVGQLDLPRVDYIKCDAEGFDVDIIKGAEKTLRRDHPRLAICTYHADDHFLQLHDFLTRLGYRVEGKGFLHVPGKFRVLMLHAA